MDKLPPVRRSENMRRIRSHDTKPEVAVRKIVHALGFRFRLHRRDLPGSPDLVLPKYRAIIFVHGCFWHQHPGCREGRLPSSNRDYWIGKLGRNVKRDRASLRMLRKLGWNVLIVWECEVGRDVAARRLRGFLLRMVPRPVPKSRKSVHLIAGSEAPYSS